MFLAINDFARRHRADSPFSHFDGNDMDLIEVVTKAIEDGTTKPGFAPGVTLVTVNPQGFYSGVVKLTEDTPPRSVYQARRPGEEPVPCAPDPWDPA